MFDTDDLPDLITPWLIMWAFFAYLQNAIWLQMVDSLRRLRKSKIKNIIMLIIYILLIFLEFFFYTQVIRTSLRSDFGFWFSKLFPTIIFYYLVSKLVRCIYRSTRRGFLKMKGLRVYKKYHFLFPSIEMTFAFAYSSFIGILLSAITIGVTYYIDSMFPRPKKVKSRRFKTV